MVTVPWIVCIHGKMTDDLTLYSSDDQATIPVHVGVEGVKKCVRVLFFIRMLTPS